MLQRKFDKTVKEFFPNAMDAKDTSIHYLGKMQIEHDINVSKVLMATSVCSDCGSEEHAVNPSRIISNDSDVK